MLIFFMSSWSMKFSCFRTTMTGRSYWNNMNWNIFGQIMKNSCSGQISWKDFFMKKRSKELLKRYFINATNKTIQAHCHEWVQNQKGWEVGYCVIRCLATGIASNNVPYLEKSWVQKLKSYQKKVPEEKQCNRVKSIQFSNIICLW